MTVASLDFNNSRKLLVHRCATRQKPREAMNAGAALIPNPNRSRTPVGSTAQPAATNNTAASAATSFHRRELVWTARNLSSSSRASRASSRNLRHNAVDSSWENARARNSLYAARVALRSRRSSEADGSATASRPDACSTGGATSAKARRAAETAARACCSNSASTVNRSDKPGPLGSLICAARLCTAPASTSPVSGTPATAFGESIAAARSAEAAKEA
eukprot:scaffold20031_cov111-Isochrysis_galbana.AAC.2